MEPRIIFEDQDLLVLEKPSGMIVNRSDTTKGEKTVQEWVETKFKIQNSKFKIDKELDFYKRAGIVHRLDKETSGILLVAKNPESFINLQAQFKERKVQKTYIALTHGKIEPEIGEINVSVGRLPWNRKRFGVLSEGREAVTKYKVLSIKYYKRHSGKPKAHPESPMAIRDAGQASMTGKEESLSLLELYPETGRTHQIRVHLQYIHHPIFSDPLYAGRKTSRNDRKLLPRVFLHAAKISFNHPTSGELLSFESPLPDDLNKFLIFLKS